VAVETLEQHRRDDVGRRVGRAGTPAANACVRRHGGRSARRDQLPFAFSICALYSLTPVLYSLMASLAALMCGSASACSSLMNFFRQST
jgi:hypothetical protein